MEKNKLEESNSIMFCVKHGEGSIDTHERFRKSLVIILYDVHKYFGDKNTLYMGEEH
jgi:hypothetical protein